MSTTEPGLTVGLHQQACHVLQRLHHNQHLHRCLSGCLRFPLGSPWTTVSLQSDRMLFVVANDSTQGSGVNKRRAGGHFLLWLIFCFLPVIPDQLNGSRQTRKMSREVCAVRSQTRQSIWDFCHSYDWMVPKISDMEKCKRQCILNLI